MADENNPNESKPEENKPDGEQKSGLLAEKIELRKRAQKAETDLATMQKQFEELQKNYDTINGELGTFKFRDAKTDTLKKALEKIPDDKTIDEKAMGLLQASIATLKDPKTLEADITQLVSAALVVKDQKKQTTPADSGTGTMPVAGADGIQVNFEDPFSMLKIRKSNPEGFKQGVAAANSKK